MSLGGGGCLGKKMKTEGVGKNEKKGKGKKRLKNDLNAA